MKSIIEFFKGMREILRFGYPVSNLPVTECIICHKTEVTTCLPLCGSVRFCIECAKQVTGRGAL